MTREMSPGDDIADYIIRRLASGASPQDVILAVCERTGLNWQDAEALVEGALVYGEREIARWQLAIMVVTGMATALGGLWVLFRFALRFAGSVNQVANLSGLSIDSIGPLAWLAVSIRDLGEISIGAAMVAGGGLGVYWAVRRALFW